MHVIAAAPTRRFANADFIRACPMRATQLSRATICSYAAPYRERHCASLPTDARAPPPICHAAIFFQPAAAAAAAITFERFLHTPPPISSSFRAADV